MQGASVYQRLLKLPEKLERDSQARTKWTGIIFPRVAVYERSVAQYPNIKLGEEESCVEQFKREGKHSESS